MTNLDDLLSSYRGIINQDLADKPLLTASDFKGELSSAGHLFVGCAIRWLAHIDALENKTALLVSQSIGNSQNSSAYLSEKTLPRGLFISDIKLHIQDFCTSYFSVGGGYGSDYFDVNVTQRNLSSLGDVKDSIQTFRETSEFLDKRLEDFKKGNKTFPRLLSEGESTLSDIEKTQDGWLHAIKNIDLSENQTEKSRRQNISKLWALVDFSPNIASEEIASSLINLSCTNLPDGVFESARNSIADFPFVLAINSIFSDTDRLSTANILGELLGVWKNLDDTQTSLLIEKFDALNHKKKFLISTAVRDGVRHKEKWAQEWDQILSE